jgi:ATP-binding cassette subfamily C (CFTR/MRP) protein 1
MSDSQGAFILSACSDTDLSVPWEDQLNVAKIECITDVIVVPVLYSILLLMCLYRLGLQSQALVRRVKYTSNLYRFMTTVQILIGTVVAVVPLLELNAILGSKGNVIPVILAGALLMAFTWALWTYNVSNESRYGWVKRGSGVTRFVPLASALLTGFKMFLVASKFGSRQVSYFYVLFIVWFAFQALLGLIALMYFPTRSRVMIPSNDGTYSFEEFYFSVNDDPDSGSEALCSEKIECPEKDAGLISSLFFCWMNDMMTFGYKVPLQAEHIWKLNKQDTAEFLYEQFAKNWNEEVKTKGFKEASLYNALSKVFWWKFFWGGTLKIFNDASQFVGPMFLSLLTKFVNDPNQPAWQGYMYALLLFLGQVIGAIAECQYFQAVMRGGMQVRSVLITAVFRKSLVVDNETKKNTSTGRINNLMSADAESFQTLAQNFHQIWSAPFRIIVALLFLYLQVGWASLVGCSLLLTLLPLQKKMIEASGKLVKQSLGRSDERIKVVNETMEAMNVVKAYAWERSFDSKVKLIRSQELALLFKAAILGAINYFIIFTIPVFVAVVTFTVYAATGNELTPEKAFTALALFDILRFPMFTLPTVINQLIAAKVSLNRIRDFMIGGEINIDEAYKPISSSEPAIRVAKSSFAWSTADDAEITLHDIDFSVKNGELLAVIGSTGSGKSSIISAVLGEMIPVPTKGTDELGHVELRGNIAYVPQQAWIFNDTIRNNILFGREMSDDFYQDVIHVSSLERDFDLMQTGDQTEIGERGVNLSGGQKQRVSIARAVYADADVYLLDDPLSALDAHVAKDVFEKCILEFLGGKTRVLVTNQVQFVSKADRILLVKDGRIDSIGTYDEMMANSPSFKELIMKQIAEEENDEKVMETTSSSHQAARKKPNEKQEDKKKTQLVVDEERETGHVSFRVVWGYLKVLGSFPFTFLTFFLFLLAQLFSTGNSVWLSLWSENYFGPGTKVSFYIGIYCAWALSNCFTVLTYQLMLAKAANNAGKVLHENMYSNLLRAPMRFFNENPVGRLLNRFTKDQADVDRQFAGMMSLYVAGLLSLIATIVVIAASTPLVILFFVPIMIVLYICGEYFQATARELKRLDAISRSPLYAHLSQSLNGLSTIRAYRVHQEVAKDNATKLDNAIRMTHAIFSANRWLTIRLELLGGMMVGAAAVFLVADRGNIRPAIAALSLSYALQITSLMTRNIRFSSILEQSFNSVERIQYYGSVPTEAPAIIEDNRPPKSWPEKGDVEFIDVRMRYRDNLPLVIRGLSFKVNSGEKVGIVGRTGAGKSSLFVSLFRLVELSGGKIIIDGYDVAKIGLEDLRSKISIIPQDPVLFTGTVRFNLDPFEEHSDAEVWDALRRAYLQTYIESSKDGLQMKVEEKGSNFSVGQRQLLCMARALLRNSKILVLDEATASVDVNTDSLIQKTIREEFKSCTMLIIAHRLNTIIDW